MPELSSPDQSSAVPPPDPIPLGRSVAPTFEVEPLSPSAELAETVTDEANRSEMVELCSGGMILRFHQPLAERESAVALPVSISLLGNDDSVIAKVELNNLPQKAIVSLVEALESKSAEEVKAESIDLKVSRLERVLLAGGTEGATISSPFGSSLSEILTGYTHALRTSESLSDCRIAHPSERRSICLDESGAICSGTQTNGKSSGVKAAFQWIDLANPSECTFEELKSKYKLDAEDVLSCLKIDEETIVERHSDHLFAVVNILEVDPENPNKIRNRELHMFVGKNFLITSYDLKCSEVDKVFARVQMDGLPKDKSPGLSIFSNLLRTVTENNEQVVKHFDQRIKGLFRDMQQGELNQKAMTYDITDIYESLDEITRLLEPLNPMFDDLLVDDSLGKMGIESRAAFKKVNNVHTRTEKQVERMSGRIDNLLSTYRSVLSIRDSEITKRLTIAAGMAVSWTIFGAIFGANFEGLPFKSDTWMYGSLAAAGLGSLALLGWAAYKKWWRSG